MRLIKFASLVVVFILLAIAITSVYAATIAVDTLVDGIGVAGCSLREAIDNANTGGALHGCTTGTAGADTIRLDVGGSYTLTTGAELGITTPITIIENTGITAAIESATTSGALSTTWRVFNVTSTGNLTLTGITIRNGRTTSSGGCINSVGTLTINGGSVIEGCRSGGSSGGINSSGTGTLTMNNVTVQNNRAGFATTGIGGGAAITNITISISNVAFISNVALPTSANVNGYGGGLLVSVSTSGSVTLDGLTFTGNSASGNGSGTGTGGALAKLGLGSLTVTNSVFTLNTTSNNPGGGAIVNRSTGTLTVTNSRFINNSAGGNGDAFLNANTGTADTITGSCITGHAGNTIVHAAGSAIGATGNWWGTSWGPRMAGITGSRYSNGDSIPPNGLTPVNVGWATGGNEINIPPTGSWLTSAPTVAGATCQTCVGASSIGYARSCS